MIEAWCMAAGFLMDLVFGDPRKLVHPVQIIGWFISRLTAGIQKIAKNRKNRLLIGGGVMTAAIVVGTYLVCFAWLKLLNHLHPFLAILGEIFMIYQILAVKSLRSESMKVYAHLIKGDLPAARYAISWLVGRDTEHLSEEETVKAAVETVAENTADGVAAPLFFIAFGGAPLGMAYKAINTLDSMVGYRNEEYQYLGRCSARLDDLANWIPARLCALFMIAASYLLSMDAAEALRIYKRDRRAHLSPNSAQTEAAAAGALGIQLGGTHSYFGKPVEKPTIGDSRHQAEPEDIRKVNTLLYATAALLVLAGMLIRGFIG